MTEASSSRFGRRVFAKGMVAIGAGLTAKAVLDPSVTPAGTIAALGTQHLRQTGPYRAYQAKLAEREYQVAHDQLSHQAAPQINTSCQPDFNWRDYIDLEEDFSSLSPESKQSAQRDLLTQTLDLLSSFPQMQGLLKANQALYVGKKLHILLSDTADSHYIFDGNNKLVINIDETENSFFIDSERHKFFAPLAVWLIHEVDHAADARRIPNMKIPMQNDTRAHDLRVAFLEASAVSLETEIGRQLMPGYTGRAKYNSTGHYLETPIPPAPKADQLPPGPCLPAGTHAERVSRRNLLANFILPGSR